MYVTSTRVSTADQPPRNASIVAEGIESWLTDIDGFEGFLMLSRPGTTIGLSFWRDRETAERHRAARLQLIERLSSIVDVTIEEQLDFDVTFARFRELFAVP